MKASLRENFQIYGIDFICKISNAVDQLTVAEIKLHHQCNPSLFLLSYPSIHNLISNLLFNCVQCSYYATT